MYQFIIYSNDRAPSIALIDVIANQLGSVQMKERGNRIAWLGLEEPSLELRIQLQAQCSGYATDSVWLKMGQSFSDFSLIAMDMDSTLITIECIDELADYCGKKAEVAAITEATMRGEITDYDTSLRQRVALLAGLSTKALDAVYRDRLRFSRGAKQLVETAKAHGLKTLLVSGGFTYFTSRVQQELGIDYARSNELEIENGHLTGRVVGEIVNAAVKAQEVKFRCQELGVAATKAITVGDGANDMKMMAVSGFSVAYHAKPAVHARANAAIHHGGLDTLAEWLKA
jgi:phosphoserine phosphatase